MGIPPYHKELCIFKLFLKCYVFLVGKHSKHFFILSQMTIPLDSWAANQIWQGIRVKME